MIVDDLWKPHSVDKSATYAGLSWDLLRGQLLWTRRKAWIWRIIRSGLNSLVDFSFLHHFQSGSFLGFPTLPHLFKQCILLLMTLRYLHSRWRSMNHFAAVRKKHTLHHETFCISKNLFYSKRMLIQVINSFQRRRHQRSFIRLWQLKTHLSLLYGGKPWWNTFSDPSFWMSNCQIIDHDEKRRLRCAPSNASCYEGYFVISHGFAFAAESSGNLPIGLSS